jgi:hypothetical protein
MQRKAMVKMAGLQFKFQYKESDNKVSNALSRVGHIFMHHNTSAVVPVWIQEVLNSYAMDPLAQELVQELAITTPNTKGYSLAEDLIIYKKKIWWAIIQHCRPRSSMPFMPQLWVAILVYKQHSKGSANSSGGLGLSSKLKSLSNNAVFVRQLNMDIASLHACYVLCLIQMRHVRIYQWTLLMGYPNVEATQ